MDHRTLLADAAGRPADSARQVLDGITADALNARPGDSGSSIAWLVWHAARQADVQLAALRGGDETWTLGGWAERTGVPRGAGDFGFGDTPEEVAGLRVSDPVALLAYVDAVVEALIGYTSTLSASDLDDVIDTAWTPAVTRGVRLISIIDDAVAHIGQAAYVRGLVTGWTIGY